MAEAGRGARFAVVLAAALTIVLFEDAASFGTADAAAPVVVRTYTAGRITLGDTPYVIVRGLLANESALSQGDVLVFMRARKADGGEVVGDGSGQSWLGTLRPGDVGPFSVAIPYCCPEEIGSYEFKVTSVPTPDAAYHDLTASGFVLRDDRGLPRLYGELENTGVGFTDASSTRVFVGFWSGDRLIDIRAPILPVFYDDGDGGQAQPPGYRLPWSTTVPDAAYDRTEVWATADTYPTGMFPVPVGVRDVSARLTLDGGLDVAATVFNCGVVAASGIVLVITARDDAGQLIQFDKALLSADQPLAPGDAGAITVHWPSARPDAVAAHINLTAFAVDSQSLRPAAVPCGAPASIYLPLAWAGAAPAADSPRARR